MTNSSLKTQISLKLGESRLFYVCRDVERALAGLRLNLPNYHVITNGGPFAKTLTATHPDIIVPDSSATLDTWDLLRHKKTKSIIQKNDYVLVFKNTPQIERECAQNGWRLLNPSAALAAEVEEKITQIKWLGPLKKYLPKYKITVGKKIQWQGEKFILQFNRSHTGSGTILITSKKQLTEIQKKFPQREVRLARFVRGPLFTNNNVVWNGKVIIGNISYQITGLKPFTDLPFATIGNDWQLPRKILSENQIKKYAQIAADVGKRLAEAGWKGLFGIDVVVEEKTGKLYLLEINARQPASTTFESELQDGAVGGVNGNAVNMFEAHLASLLKIGPDRFEPIKIQDGAQIIQRVTKNLENKKLIELKNNLKVFSKNGVRTIFYDNKKLGADWLRIQLKSGIMAKHTKLNDQGGEILNLVTVITREDGCWGADRAGVLLIKNGKILLMKRKKYGKNFFSIPAGTVEKGEDLKTTALRECKEETSLDCDIDESKPPVKVTIGLLSSRDEYYFSAKNIRGKAKLGGPELSYNSPDNWHELRWVELKKLKKINFLPRQLLEYLLA